MKKEYRIAICEDNDTQAAALKESVSNIFSQYGIKISTDIFDSGEALKESEQNYDLIFLDCLLPGINGIEAATELRKTLPDADIIYTTAYTDYAVDGYKTNAIRYLLKPISDEDLTEAIKVFLDRQNNICFISFTEDKKSYSIKSSEIVYIEVKQDGKGSLIRTATQTFLIKKSLLQLERELADVNFFRTSKQFIVNADYICSREKNRINLKNGESVDISARKVNDFNNFFAEYIKRNS